jgi:hypothetical protein
MAISPNQFFIREFNNSLAKQIQEAYVLKSDDFKAYQRLLEEAGIHNIPVEDALEGYKDLCDILPEVWVEGLIEHLILVPHGNGYAISVLSDDETEPAPGGGVGLCPEAERGEEVGPTVNDDRAFAEQVAKALGCTCGRPVRVQFFTID